MFITCKVFFKKHFKIIYKPVHDILFPLYLKYFRNKKLQRFTDKTLYDFSFAGITFKIWLNPDNGFVDEEIYANGVYEPEVLLLYKQYIKPGDVYVDIGTNIGQHALFAAGLVGSQGKVLCYEPIKDLFVQVTNSKIQNNFTHMDIVNKAIGQDVGEAKIYINRKNIGASSLYKQSISVQEETIHIGIAEELATLSKINFIKIDTEGYEWIVLQTIRSYIEKHKPIVFFEYTPDSYGEIGKVEVLNYFIDMGYLVQDVENGYLEVDTPKEWVQSFVKKQTNFLCVPK